MPTENTTPALLWLLIGIPTVPRPTGGADYLGRSLSTVPALRIDAFVKDFNLHFHLHFEPQR